MLCFVGKITNNYLSSEMSKQIYAININLSKFENNQIWQVAKSATASHLIYEKEMQFRKLANFVEVCNFEQHL